MTEHDNDCLHCRLLIAMAKFCKEHPDSYAFGALATVIGDQLATEGSTPYQDEFIADINQRILQRIKVFEKMVGAKP